MWMVQMNNNGPVANGLAELNHDTQDEVKEIRDGVTGEGQGLSEEDESQINGDTENEDMNDGRVEGVQPKAHDQAVMQRPQQQPQGPLVRWDRFLPLRSLKVLLVENDDSTRHVVSALLRNCGYEVVAVANGLQAWKFLEDLTNHIDLILAEVVMPFLSGIGLLSKIMSHKTCKNIPVILMSSHDSMNIVFKCLSKGAVDFLVKPIRKNELKNLWQHVWRKCHSSSGSGSESGIRTQKFTQSKSAEESGNQTGSNNEDDIGSIGLHVRNGSDNGSGTQSSWTERAVEVDSPKPMSPWGQLADPPDSTCAQVIYSRTEAVTDNWVPMTTTKECERQDEKYENDVMGKDLQIGMPRIPNIQPEDPSEKVNIARNNEENFPERNLKKDGEQIDNRLELNSKKLSEELRNLGEVIHVITTSTDPQIETAIRNIPNNHSKNPNTKDKVIHEKKEMPSLELSLKRHRDIGDTRNAHDRNVLRHSDISAFSRYNSASTANLAPSRNVGSCSPLDNSSEAAKTESMQNYQSNSNSTPPNQRSNGSSNNIDMSSTTDDIVTKQAVQHNEPAPKSTLKCLQPSVAVQPVQNGHISVPQSMAQSKTDTAITDTILTQARGKNQQVQVQHHHHHYHHYHHHVHDMSQQQQQQQQQQQHDELSLKKMVAAAPQRGSSNMLGTSNVGNYSGNGNGSGSDQGSNGQNGSNTALISRGSNMESNDEITEKSGISGGIGFGSRIGVDQNRFAQREAALNKFRQKRKERCFEKKVRYQSRKKLAEQRPRIRGQFVRQVAQGNKEKDVRS